MIRQYQAVQQQLPTVYSRVTLWQDKLYNAAVCTGFMSKVYSLIISQDLPRNLNSNDSGQYYYPKSIAALRDCISVHGRNFSSGAAGKVSRFTLKVAFFIGPI